LLLICYFLANLGHRLIMIRLVIIYNRLYSFENVFLYLYQNISAVEKQCLDCNYYEWYSYICRI